MNEDLPTLSLAPIERAVALVVLVTVLPALILIGFVLRTNTDEPVLLTDDLLSRDGSKFRVHRFRTTGRGSRAFRAFGVWLRSTSIDELPALWDVARGQIAFRHLLCRGK